MIKVAWEMLMGLGLLYHGIRTIRTRRRGTRPEPSFLTLLPDSTSQKLKAEDDTYAIGWGAVYLLVGLMAIGRALYILAM
jgi:hypothetical protein